MDVCVVDYGLGNLHSVAKALEAAGARVRVSADPAEVDAAPAVCLPGVGAFGAGVAEIDRRGLRAPLVRAAADRPFLGICLGLQLLLDRSEESPGARGLGVVAGDVRRFAADGVRVPQIGWNRLRAAPGGPLAAFDGAWVYFVHSYYVAPADPAVVAAEAEHGIRFAAAIARDRLLATQFHPEKSGAAGLAILRAWIGSLS